MAAPPPSFGELQSKIAAAAAATASPGGAGLRKTAGAGPAPVPAPPTAPHPGDTGERPPVPAPPPTTAQPPVPAPPAGSPPGEPVSAPPPVPAARPAGGFAAQQGKVEEDENPGTVQGRLRRLPSAPGMPPAALSTRGGMASAAGTHSAASGHLQAGHVMRDKNPSILSPSDSGAISDNAYNPAPPLIDFSQPVAMEAEQEFSPFVRRTVLDAMLGLQSGVGPVLNELIGGDSYRAEVVDPTPFITLPQHLDQWSVFVLERVAVSGQGTAVVKALLNWLPGSLLARTLARGMDILSGLETRKIAFDTFIHSLSNYRAADDILGELLETVVELMVCELLVAVTGFVGGGESATNANVLSALISAAYSAILRPINPRSPSLFGPLRDRRVELWYAILGNLSPVRTPQLLDVFRDHITGGPGSVLGGITEAQFPIVLGALAHVRTDLTDPASVVAITQTLEYLKNLILQLLGRARNKRDAVAAEVGADAMSAAHRLIQGCNVEESNAQLTTAHSVEMRAFFDVLERFFTELDAANPRKSQHPRLGQMTNFLMSSILVRTTKPFYGGQVQEFYKRILKTAYERDLRDNCLGTLLHLLRGPRCRDWVPVPILFLPRLHPVSTTKPSTSSGGNGNEQAGSSGSQLVGGTYMKSDHEYSCIMPSMPENEYSLFRADTLEWIHDRFFDRKNRNKLRDLHECFPLLADVILAMSANSLQATHIRLLLDLRENKHNTFAAVAMRAARIIMDPRSGFVMHARTTRIADERGLGQQAVDALLDDVSRATHEFFEVHFDAMYAPIAIDNTGGQSDKPYRFTCAIRDTSTYEQPEPIVRGVIPHVERGGTTVDSYPDVTLQRIWELRLLNEDKFTRMHVVQETLRAIAFLPEVRTILDRLMPFNLLMHSYLNLRFCFSLALQRAMLHHPRERPTIVLSVARYILGIQMDSVLELVSYLNLLSGLLDNWAYIIEEGADSRNRSDVAHDPDVIYSVEGGYPQWTAETEASALLCLAHTSQPVRTQALTIFERIHNIREAQREIVDAFAPEAVRSTMGSLERATQSTRALGSASVSSPSLSGPAATAAGAAAPPQAGADQDGAGAGPGGEDDGPKVLDCVYDIVWKEEEDVVQRALHRFMVSAAGGEQDPTVKAFATSAPTLDKTATMGELWWSVLPELATRIAHLCHPGIAAVVRHSLYEHLLSGSGHGENFTLRPPEDLEQWSTNFLLLCAVATRTRNMQGVTLLEQGSGTWQLGRYESPRQKMAQFLRVVWPLLLQQTKPPNKYRAGIENAVKACSMYAVGPAVASIRAWLTQTSQRDKRKVKAILPSLFRIFRILSDTPTFVPGVIFDNGVLAALISTMTVDLTVPPEWWDTQRVVQEADVVLEAQLNLALVLDRMLEAVVTANHRWKERKDTVDQICAHVRQQAAKKPGTVVPQLPRVPPAPPRLDAINRATVYELIHSIFSIARAPRDHPLTNTVSRVCFRAMSRLAQMGPVLTDAQIDDLCGSVSQFDSVADMLDGHALNLPGCRHFIWLLEGERQKFHTFRWLLVAHTTTLCDLYYKNVYCLERENAECFFHALCDQLLPSETAPPAPNTGVTEHSTDYYHQLAALALNSSARHRHVVSSSPISEGGTGEDAAAEVNRADRSSAVHMSSVFQEEQLSVTDKLYRLNEMGLLAMAMRAIMDPKRLVRTRAYKVIEAVVEQLLHDAMVNADRLASDSASVAALNEAMRNVPPAEQVARATGGRAAAAAAAALAEPRSAAITMSDAGKQLLEPLRSLRRTFRAIMDRHRVVFTASSSAACLQEARELAEMVSICVQALNRTAAFFEEVFTRPSNRAEWGGHTWLAQLLAPFARYCVLHEAHTAAEGARQDADDVVVTFSDYGKVFLEKLFGVCARFPPDEFGRSMPVWTSLVGHYAPLLPQNPTAAGGAQRVSRNADLVAQFLLYITSSADTRIPLCEEIARSCFVHDSTRAAEWFIAPLSHDSRFSDTESYTPEELALQCESSVLLLSSLVNADIDPFVPYLHIILNFAVLHMKSTTRFVDSHGGSASFSQRDRLLTLLMGVLNAIEPLVALQSGDTSELAGRNISKVLAGSKWNASVFMPSESEIRPLQRLHRMRELLRAGIDEAHLMLDWSKAIRDVGAPLQKDAPQIDVTTARSVGALCPQAFVHEWVSILGQVVPDLSSRWGAEAIYWARDSGEFTMTLKAGIFYTTLGYPATTDTMHELARLCASLADTVHLHLMNMFHSSLASLPKAGGTAHGKVRRRSLSVMSVQQATPISSTAHYQDTIRVSSALACLLGLMKTLAKENMLKGMPQVYWLTAALLRCALGPHEPRMYQYGMLFLKELLRSADSIAEAMDQMASAQPTFAPAWNPEFPGMLPLLIPGILSTDAVVARQSRELAVKLMYTASAMVDTHVSSIDLRFMLSVAPYLAELASVPPAPASVRYVRQIRMALTSAVPNLEPLLLRVLDNYVEGTRAPAFLDGMADWIVSCKLPALEMVEPVLQMCISYSTPFACSVGLQLTAKVLNKLDPSMPRAEVLGHLNAVVRRAALIANPPHEPSAAAVSQAAAAAGGAVPLGGAATAGGVAAGEGVAALDVATVQVKAPRMVHRAAVAVLSAVSSIFTSMSAGDLKSLGDTQANQYSGLQPINASPAMLLRDAVQASEGLTASMPARPQPPPTPPSTGAGGSATPVPPAMPPPTSALAAAAISGVSPPLPPDAPPGDFKPPPPPRKPLAAAPKGRRPSIENTPHTVAPDIAAVPYASSPGPSQSTVLDNLPFNSGAGGAESKG